MSTATTHTERPEAEPVLTESARLEFLDPPKLPALAARIWSAIKRANLQSDLDVYERPADGDTSALGQHIDGYLCEDKNIQVKDVLHVLAQAPTGAQLRVLTAAMLRLPSGALPAL